GPYSCTAFQAAVVGLGRHLPGFRLDHRRRDLAAIRARGREEHGDPAFENRGFDLHPLRPAQHQPALLAPACRRRADDPDRAGGIVVTLLVVLSGSIAMLLVLLALSIPIFVAFLILNFTGVLLLFGTSGFGLFANSIYSTATSGALTAVPLFIAMGEILFRSGAMEVLFDSLDRLVGRIRGRQYIVCILLSAILGALSGAAMAVAGLLGRSLFPAMRKRGYDTEFSAGTILAAASLDPIMPPSVLAILVATTAAVSTGKML